MLLNFLLIKIIGFLFWGLRIYSDYLFAFLEDLDLLQAICFLFLMHTHSHTHTHTHAHTHTQHTHTHTRTHTFTGADAFIFKHKLTTSWISTGSNALNLTAID